MHYTNKQGHAAMIYNKARNIAWAIDNGYLYVYAQRCPLTGRRVYAVTNDVMPHMTKVWG